MLEALGASEQEEQLEALLLARILRDDSTNTELARNVARAEAHRLVCVAMLIIEHLQDARLLLGRALLGSTDPELLAILLNLKDGFGGSITGELLAWRAAFSKLPTWRDRGEA